MRIGALYINSMRNVAMQYKYIENIHINNIIKFEYKTASLKEIIITVKNNGANIFVAAE